MEGVHFRQSAAERRRMYRRRRAGVLLAAAVVVAGVTYGVVDATGGGSGRATSVVAGREAVSRHRRDGAAGPSTTARAPSSPSPTAASTTTTVAAGPSTSTATSSGIFTEPAIASYLASQGGEDMTAAVTDLSTGTTSLYRPGVQEDTASIVKADILATLLDQTGGTLTASEESTATLMIENSDNDAATDLWDQVGEAPAIAAFDRSAGLTDTTPGSDGYWGLTLTTAADQVRLLGDLTGSTGFDVPNRTYELGLMQQVEADQQWGISGGVPAGVQISVKNGWLPLEGDSDWQVNSIGWVDGDGHDYVVAILTQGSATEAQGIAAIQGLASLVYAASA